MHEIFLVFAPQARRATDETRKARDPDERVREVSNVDDQGVRMAVTIDPDERVREVSNVDDQGVRMAVSIEAVEPTYPKREVEQVWERLE